MVNHLVRRLSLLAVIVSLFAVAPAVMAAPASCGSRVNNTHAKLLECVTLEGVREHQAVLQEIADANGGTRASGTPGYDLSADYAASVFRDAGYNVTVQEFQFQTFTNLAPSILERVAPPPAGPVAHTIASYSGSGDVTALVSVPTGDFRGCNASDWAGFPAGHIALVQRGAPPGFPVACTFGLKATNAFNAGAAGVIIYNNVAGAPAFTLGNTFTLEIPVVGVTLAIGQELAALVPGGLTMHLQTSTERFFVTTSNVLAETQGGDPNNVVMVGAHLDSVAAGPGINDNGSGSAAILEVAQQMAKVKPVNKVRFALWGAEEANLVGSTFYVNDLLANNPAELERVALYLNFDMIGSPNYVFFVYDGDNSDQVGAGPGPAGSTQIEDVFERFYLDRGIPFKGTDFSGRSDYGPFIAVGIPSGGLFTGAEGIKTAEEAAIWGGTAGLAYDPCYHQACDTYENNSDEALATNADAVAFATLQYAMNTSDINGLPGKDNFPPVQPVPPAPPGGTTGGGGLHDDHDLPAE